MFRFTGFVLFMLLFTTSIFSTIINVPGDQSTIQAGINAAVNGDTVLVADNTYYENINFKGKAITVASYFLIDGDTSHISGTIIDGSQPSHPDSGSVVFFVSDEDTTSVLCGFTITGGTGTVNPFPARFGGGIACNSAGAKIIHNHITKNQMVSNLFIATGGGISAGPPGDTSWLVVQDNVIDSNSVTHTAIGGAGNGGGIAIHVNVRLVENIIENNTAQSTYGTSWGGGAYLSGDAVQPLVRYCIGNTIRHNQAISPTGTANDGGIGGGLAVASVPKAIIKHNDISFNAVESNVGMNVDCWGGGVMLQNQDSTTIFAENWVTNNKALNLSFCRGAGIAIWHYDKMGSPRLIKNIIAHNTAGTEGGGLYIAGLVPNSASLINNTICDNSATQGGAVYIGWNNQHVSHPEIENSILWDNGSSIFINTGDINVNYSDVEGGWPSGIGNMDSDPFLFDSVMTNGDTIFCCLRPNSPCIDAGNPDPAYNDPENPNNPGFALWPAMDRLRNDMGRYGGITDSLIITGLFEMDDGRGQLPVTYQLSQNYPNPFNPTTTIEFALPRADFVTLTIYNILGEKVATLVSERLTVGKYKYGWDASGLASGVYLYRLEAGSFNQTQKLILLR